MDRVLCQLCYTIVRCGDNHSCFFYDNDEECYSIRNLNESDEKDTMNAMSEEVHSEKFNDGSVTIYSSLPENIVEATSVKTADNNEHISLLPGVTRKTKCHSLLPATSNNKWSLSSSDNSMLDSTTVIRQCTLNARENNSASKSFWGSENTFKSPTTVTNTGFLMGKKNLDEIESPRNLLDTCVATRADPGSFSSNLNAKLDFKSSQEFMKNASAVSGVRPRLHTTAVKRKHDSDLCPPKVKNEAGLVSHDGKRAGEKRFECNTCKKRFSRQGHLKNHFRTHTGERPFECEYCERRFSRKDHLDLHNRTHTGEKNFKCEICQKDFAVPSNLRRHIAEVHIQGKPFKCGDCGKAFKSNTGRIKHRKIKH